MKISLRMSAISSVKIFTYYVDITRYLSNLAKVFIVLFVTKIKLIY